MGLLEFLLDSCLNVRRASSSYPGYLKACLVLEWVPLLRTEPVIKASPPARPLDHSEPGEFSYKQNGDAASAILGCLIGVIVAASHLIGHNRSNDTERSFVLPDYDEADPAVVSPVLRTDSRCFCE